MNDEIIGQIISFGNYRFPGYYWGQLPVFVIQLRSRGTMNGPCNPSSGLKLCIGRVYHGFYIRLVDDIACYRFELDIFKNFFNL